jgi:hypothetical protein
MRLAGVAKMGYYRTPDRATEQILRRLALKAPGGPIVLGDPCCGEGIALKAAADYLKGLGADPLVTYGIEPDEKRAEESKKRLDHVVVDGYENTAITNKAFSLWWFNPPYDTASSDEDEKKERKEVIFLRDTFKYIAPHGVLVCIVPQHVLKNLAPVLTNRFYDLTVERFDDGEYEAFGQVVVFGYRKPAHAPLGTKEEREHLAFLSTVDPEFLPSLDQEPKRIYEVPQGVIPRTFFGERIEMGKVMDTLPDSPAWAVFKSLISPGYSDIKLGTPLMTLKPGQYANIIASGALNGVIGRGPDRHMVIGFTKKIAHTSSELDEDGKTIVTRTEDFCSGTRLFTADGRYYELSDESRVDDGEVVEDIVDSEGEPEEGEVY